MHAVGRLQPYKASQKKLNGAFGFPDPIIGIQLQDNERSHFVTSFSSLQLLLGCVLLLLELGVCCKKLILITT